jgi:small-conductance mechanosensitive channel
MINIPGIVILAGICVTGYYVTTTFRAKQWTHLTANLIILGALYVGAQAIVERDENESWLQLLVSNYGEE